MNAYDRISNSNYLPTTTDILYSRLKKSVVVEEHFRYNHITFKFIDVEIKNDMRKLLPCFQDVFAIIFCINLVDYRKTIDDSTTNKMKETMKQVSEIANCKWLEKKPVVILFTHVKEFKEKTTRNKF